MGKTPALLSFSFRPFVIRRLGKCMDGLRERGREDRKEREKERGREAGRE